MRAFHLRTLTCGVAAAIAVLGCNLSFAAVAPAAPTDYHLQPNQTFGFGANQLLVFTYDESFDCVAQPTDDRNFNGLRADSDPSEVNPTDCQIGSNAYVDPTGASVKQTEPLYVMVPMFSLNHDTNPDDALTPALGATLIKLFGAVPEAFKLHPLVAVQCPNPGYPAGGCTMHTSRVDIFWVLAALHKLPASPRQNVFVPTPNHDHLVNDDAINTKQIWWQVITVLVTSPSQWPNAQGTSGITSVAKLKQAESRGQAIPAPSNFFLFFASHSLGSLKQASAP